MDPLYETAASDIFKAYSEIVIEQALLDAFPPTMAPPVGQTGLGQGAASAVPTAGMPPTSELPSTPIVRVAVIGAGCAGLHAAALLGSNPRIKAEVDVLEASDRVGGRLYTHNFGKGKWDYFDVGAMRFPCTPVMTRTFELFCDLKIPKAKYTIQHGKNFMVYNDVRKRREELDNSSAWEKDPFDVFWHRDSSGKTTKPGLDPEWAQYAPGDLLHEAIGPWIKKMVDVYGEHNPVERMKKLKAIFKAIDTYSTRSYLSIATDQDGYPVIGDASTAARKAYPADIINWIETTTSGTGWFDRALVETVMEEIAFQFDKSRPTDLDWYYVEGGTEVIADKMRASLDAYPTVKLKYNHRVTSVELHPSEAHSSTPIKQYPYFSIKILNQDGDVPATLPLAEMYSHVIFAIPPPCVHMVDVSTCKLDFLQRKALRELHISPSTKVGMKFKTAWWKEPGIDITQGGQSVTDRTVRTVVYPSHGEFTSTALIASYSWTQDSLVLGALMQDNLSKKRLKQLVLSDLAFIHDCPLEMLESELEDWYPFDWSSNPLSMGAFRLFAPNQFSYVYPNLIRPAAGTQMHFIGETLSPIHGWVAGALESAERAILQMLLPFQKTQKRPDGLPFGTGAPSENDSPVKDESGIEELKERWGPNVMTSETSLLRLLALSLELQSKEFESPTAFT
ncbi:Flavin containing amine oxidoreductase [Ceratobasidium sp. AG-Ba]|nr:Flavin containing amine oxidoreductase [Ceratobasidium sp. AG-Ba]QRW09064.1 Flavin containing amine oxidoreductase [Ceratobasidium sp. AG-Ba]